MNEFRTHGADSAIDDELEPPVEFTFPAETIEIVRKAIAGSKARDDEGEFPTLWDHLDYSSENKAVTVTRQAALDALNALGRDSLIDPKLACAAKDGHRSILLDMQQECISLRVMLATARDQFRDYERQHREKTKKAMSTEDFDATMRKADVNRDMAAACQAAIDGSRRVVPSVKPVAGDAAAVVKTVEAARAGGMLSQRDTATPVLLAAIIDTIADIAMWAGNENLLAKTQRLICLAKGEDEESAIARGIVAVSAGVSVER